MASGSGGERAPAHSSRVFVIFGAGFAEEPSRLLLFVLVKTVSPTRADCILVNSAFKIHQQRTMMLTLVRRLSA
jgi:hypothetical protein